MCVKNKTIIHVARGSNSKRDFEHDLIVTSATVRSFVHMLLGISDCNSTHLCENIILNLVLFLLIYS